MVLIRYNGHSIRNRVLILQSIYNHEYSVIKDVIMMKKHFFLLPALLFSAVTVLADNPIVQTCYTADPAPMVYEGRLYLYTSHDEDVTKDNFYTMNDWKLYSTVDMVNWTDHGTPASLKTFSWSTDNAWAPQAVARNGKIYLYVPLNNNTGAKIGVCVADNPSGPFKDPIGKALAQNGSMAIDPTVFIDDDGQAYLFWGNGNLRMVRLNSDMISTTGSVTSNISMQGFTEGPWFYKRESLYYLVYAGSGEKISYATSNAPAGPWTFKGDIFGNPSIATNHPGVVDYKGHSYCFYHNGALPGGGSFKRSVCVEEFTYGADGSIPKLTMSTKGPAAVDTLDPFQRIEAETIAFSSGLKTEVCTDSGAGINVSSINNGDYIKVKEVDFQGGVTSFEARVSSSASNAKIELHLDSQTGTLLGTCDVSGASSWTTKTCQVSGGSGKHDLFMKFVGGSGDLFKFNWWKFTQNGTGIIGQKPPENTAGPDRFEVSFVTEGIKALRLDFSQPVPQHNLTVGVYDLSGRFIVTLFSGRTHSSHLVLPLNDFRILPGVYLIKMSLDRVVVQVKSITMQ
jgi:arabinoxylan arabinofuranohydrolase